MATLAQRISEAIDASGRPNHEIAKICGVTAASVTHWRNGATKSLKALTAQKLSEATGYREKWLLTEVGPKLATEVIDVDAVDVTNRRALGQDQSNVSDYKPKHRVPLISWIQAGELSDVVDLFHPGEAVRWEDTDANCSRSTYALLVDGDSMVCTVPGMPSFPPGTVLVVDPERGGNAGDYVIAKDVHSQRATFKLLKTDGARWYLHALNKEYPAIEIDDPALRVIGRVIEAKPPTIKLI